MKKLLKILTALLLFVFVALAAAAGVFYKNAAPTLLVDMSENGGDTVSLCGELISPEFKSEKELSTDEGMLTSSFWTSKWCLDMESKALKLIHYDLTDYDFKSYLRDLKGFKFKGFRGVASMNKAKNELDIVCKGTRGDAQIVLHSFEKSKLSGKTLEIKLEEAVFKGEKGETVIPTLLKDYTASAGDKLVIKINDIDSKNTYHIKICEADMSAAPAYENAAPPERYALDKEKTAKINVKSDGLYRLDYIISKCDSESYFEIYADGKSVMSAETFKTDKSACVSRAVKLKKGAHTLKVVSEESLPGFEGLVVSDEEEASGVYVIRDSENTGNGNQAYFAVAPDEGGYCITSTELTSSVTVNSRDYQIDDMGAAAFMLNKGINTLVIKSDKPVEFKITKEAE